MIDEKKIEAAANKHNKAEYARYNSGKVEDEMICIMGKDSFKEGAKWAINEFIKDLWHPASEKPVPVIGCNNGVLVELNETKKPITLWKREYLYENISKHGNRFISRWLYIDNLFPKEGGNHD